MIRWEMENVCEMKFDWKDNDKFRLCPRSMLAECRLFVKNNIIIV